VPATRVGIDWPAIRGTSTAPGARPCKAVGQQLAAALPGRHQDEDTIPATSGNQPPSGIFRILAAGKPVRPRGSRRTAGKPANPAPFPDLGDDDGGQNGGDHHVAGHRNAVGRGQVVRGLEAEDEDHHGDHQPPVHRRQVDLPCSFLEVCCTSMRGTKPSCMAWRVTEKAPEITACEAITVASVARPISG
jgi:hypothetical protein